MKLRRLIVEGGRCLYGAKIYLEGRAQEEKDGRVNFSGIATCWKCVRKNSEPTAVAGASRIEGIELQALSNVSRRRG